jgi:hypothetical protein
VSVDAKYGLTSSMTLDFTVNTDFAQVEIDEQQVNLTRFSLFFPEKRDFFLEGQSVFDFGGIGGQAPGGGGGGGGGGQGMNTSASQADAPIVFFSRRIGLTGGGVVPIRGGGRLTGRAGRLSVGVLEIGTDEDATAEALATNFLVARVKRDVLRRSSIGLMATRRTPSLNGDGSNTVVGLDANLSFFENLQITSYYAQSRTPGLKPARQGVDGDEASYRGLFRYAADRYGFELERLKVGSMFNPEIGFMRRPDITRTFSTARFSPRPRSIRGVRKVYWEATFNRFVNSGGLLESRQIQGSFRTDFDSSDVLNVDYNANYEFLDEPFRITRSVTLPVGVYRFNDLQTSYTLGPQRRVSGTLRLGRGQFYSGHTTSMGYTGRVKLSSQLAVEPRLSMDRVRLPVGDFTTKLVGARTTYTISPRMFTSALVQYNSNSNTIETNARFRWEYEPGSDLFIVYTDGRDTTDRKRAELVNRGLAIKFTRLFRL